MALHELGLPAKNHRFDPLGRIPHRCAHCSVKVRTRQMWRFPFRLVYDYYDRSVEPPQPIVERRVLCCNCVVAETRLFISGRRPCLISQAGVTIESLQMFLRALVGLSLPGPHFRAALRTFGSEPVAFAIGSHHRDKNFF